MTKIYDGPGGDDGIPTREMWPEEVLQITVDGTVIRFKVLSITDRNTVLVKVVVSG